MSFKKRLNVNDFALSQAEESELSSQSSQTQNIDDSQSNLNKAKQNSLDVCYTCKSGRDLASLIPCFSCSNKIHSFCITEQKNLKKTNDWKCKNCQSITNDINDNTNKQLNENLNLNTSEEEAEIFKPNSEDEKFVVSEIEYESDFMENKKLPNKSLSSNKALDESDKNSDDCFVDDLNGDTKEASIVTNESASSNNYKSYDKSDNKSDDKSDDMSDDVNGIENDNNNKQNGFISNNTNINSNIRANKIKQKIRNNIIVKWNNLIAKKMGTIPKKKIDKNVQTNYTKFPSFWSKRKFKKYNKLTLKAVEKKSKALLKLKNIKNSKNLVERTMKVLRKGCIRLWTNSICVLKEVLDACVESFCDLKEIKKIKVLAENGDKKSIKLFCDINKEYKKLFGRNVLEAIGKNELQNVALKLCGGFKRNKIKDSETFLRCLRLWLQEMSLEWKRACKQDNICRVFELLCLGFDVSTNSLIDSVRNNNTKVVELLLDAGANANSVPIDGGKTVLEIAAFNQNLRIMKLLLNKGADINNLVESSSSCIAKKVPLAFELLKQRKIKPVLLLISNGFDVNYEIEIKNKSSSALKTIKFLNYSQKFGVQKKIKKSLKKWTLLENKRKKKFEKILKEGRFSNISKRAKQRLVSYAFKQ